MLIFEKSGRNLQKIFSDPDNITYKIYKEKDILTNFIRIFSIQTNV